MDGTLRGMSRLAEHRYAGYGTSNRATMTDRSATFGSSVTRTPKSVDGLQVVG